jgi:hypothetical protein
MRESVEGGNQSTGGGTDRQIRKANASTDTGRANCDRAFVVTLATIWEKPKIFIIEMVLNIVTGPDGWRNGRPWRDVARPLRLSCGDFVSP